MLEPENQGWEPPRFLRWAWFLVQLYIFLVGVELLGSAIKLAGKDAAEQLFSGLDNPLAGLAVGILATVLVQSSSVSTSIVVGLVGTGQLSVGAAIPIVMGANIGTSVTNTLVSMGHVTQREEFRRAFAGATIHDFFNLMNVLLLLPLEVLTRWVFGKGFLHASAEIMASFLMGNVSVSQEVGGFKSPIKTAVKAGGHTIQDWVEMLPVTGTLLSTCLAVVALVLIIFALVTITRNMRVLMADRIEKWLNAVLKKSGLLGICVGAVMTVLVQSSSITTSLLVPMFGAGVLKLENGFPLVMGANIGTTVTALLASLAADNPTLGLTIALAHLLFNLIGTAVFFPVRAIRRIPVRLATMLADLTLRSRVLAIGYVIIVFLVLPFVGTLLFRY